MSLNEKRFCVIIRPNKAGKKMEKTRKYKGLFIIKPEKEDVLEDLTGRIRSVITDNGGTFQEENLMGMRDLAYPIQKKEKAVYYEVSFEAKPSDIGNMTKQYRIDEDLLRTLIDRSE